MDRARYAEWKAYRRRLRVCQWFTNILTHSGLAAIGESTLIHLTASEIGLVLDLLGLRVEHCIPSYYMSPLRDIDPSMQILEACIPEMGEILMIGEVDRVMARILHSNEYWSDPNRPRTPPKVWIVGISGNAHYISQLARRRFMSSFTGDFIDETTRAPLPHDLMSFLYHQITVDCIGAHVNLPPRHALMRRTPAVTLRDAEWLRSSNALLTPCLLRDPPLNSDNELIGSDMQLVVESYGTVCVISRDDIPSAILPTSGPAQYANLLGRDGSLLHPSQADVRYATPVFKRIPHSYFDDLKDVKPDDRDSIHILYRYRNFGPDVHQTCWAFAV
ncbi:hypothetical protein BJX65DRAFT_49468 [Aspergillus insuetus]